MWTDYSGKFDQEAGPVASSGQPAVLGAPGDQGGAAGRLVGVVLTGELTGQVLDLRTWAAAVRATAAGVR